LTDTFFYRWVARSGERRHGGCKAPKLVCFIPVCYI
jgi:hypothetical protein